MLFLENQFLIFPKQSKLSIMETRDISLLLNIISDHIFNYEGTENLSSYDKFKNREAKISFLKKLVNFMKNKIYITI